MRGGSPINARSALSIEVKLRYYFSLCKVHNIDDSLGYIYWNSARKVKKYRSTRVSASQKLCSLVSSVK